MQSRRLESCVICGTSLAGLRLQRRTCDNAVCRFAYQQHLRANRATCTECGRPLSVIEESHGTRSCRDVHCQVYARMNWGVTDAERCRLCRVRLPPGCTSGLCGDRDCQTVYAQRQQAELARHRLEQFVEQTRLGTLLRDERAAAEEIASHDEYFVRVVSLVPNPLQPLPDKRREEFRERIESLVDELAKWLDSNAEPADKSPSGPGGDARSGVNPERERLVGAVCAACRGFCCRHGGTHAYLQVDTLYGLLRRPDLCLEQLVGAYLACLPEQSFSDSCVFHSETGCALPRDMRSDTCNTHFCAGQQNLQAAIERGAPPRAFVAISDGKEIVAGRFLNAEADASPDTGENG
ncbi:MAG: hypothetical protein WD894_06255 [Pirellulales bacterium]